MKKGWGVDKEGGRGNRPSRKRPKGGVLGKEGGGKQIGSKITRKSKAEKQYSTSSRKPERKRGGHERRGVWVSLSQRKQRREGGDGAEREVGGPRPSQGCPRRHEENEILSQSRPRGTRTKKIMIRKGGLMTGGVYFDRRRALGITKKQKRGCHQKLQEGGGGDQK